MRHSLVFVLIFIVFNLSGQGKNERVYLVYTKNPDEFSFVAPNDSVTTSNEKYFWATDIIVLQGSRAYMKSLKFYKTSYNKTIRLNVQKNGDKIVLTGNDKRYGARFVDELRASKANPTEGFSGTIS